MSLTETDHYLRVKEFTLKSGQPTPGQPVVPTYDTRKLRATLVLEEALELIEELGFKTSEDFHLVAIDNYNPNLDHIAKESADLSVVNTGTLISCGIKDVEVLKAIDENNLAKFGPGSYRRQDGKWMKPPNHPKPDMKTAIGL